MAPRPQGGGGFRRSRDHRVIAGVCGGIAESLGLRPRTVRVVYAFLSLMTAVVPGLLAYLLFWKIMPERQPLSEDAKALGMIVDPDDPYAGWER